MSSYTDQGQAVHHERAADVAAAGSSQPAFGAGLRQPAAAPRSASGARWLLAVAAGVLAGCGLLQPAGEAAPSAAPDARTGMVQGVKKHNDQARAGQAEAGVQLRGTHWKLLSIAGLGSIDTLAEPPGLLLDPQHDAVSGFSGCNRFFGDVELAGNRIRFGRLGVTMRYCEAPERRVERAFLGALEAAASLVHEGGRLVLQDASGKDLLHFEADMQRHAPGRPG